MEGQWKSQGVDPFRAAASSSAPPMKSHFAHVHTLSSYILIHHLYTPLCKMALRLPVLNGQLWTVSVSYQGRFPHIDSTYYRLQSPVDNYGVPRATMHPLLNGLAVTYSFSSGT